ncbi:hypothetical protein Tco_0750306 [Tanacetum coccineum]|uniref:Reverse transcriptase n=1 Tax=Tanacetum coccineum TaxID=301880 RepID=A0ABQ4Z1V3_9ASTR
MEMKPDIESMTINEYLEYEAAMKRQLWDNVRSRRSPTNYDEADFDSFHRNKSNTFNYPFSHNLPPPDPCSLHVQPYPKNYLVSTNVSNDDVYLEEDQEEDGDDGDIFYMWDITVEDVERIREFLTPKVPDEMDEVIQPLIPQPIHTTPPNDDYVARATKSILDELLEDEIVNVTIVDEEPYRLCTSGGAWILNKLRGSIANRTSWMLYRWLVKFPVILDIVRGSRLGAWLRACWTLYKTSGRMGVELSLDLFLPSIF